MTDVYQWGEMNFCALRSCFIDHLFLTSDFRQVPRRNLLQFFPFLVRCCLCCRNFHGLGHKNKFVYQVVMLQWIVSFPTIWSSWWFGRDSPTRSLVDPLAPKIHASLDLISLDLPRVTQFWLLLLILQGIAGATGVSNFLPWNPCPQGQWNRFLVLF